MEREIDSRERSGKSEDGLYVVEIEEEERKRKRRS